MSESQTNHAMPCEKVTRDRHARAGNHHFSVLVSCKSLSSSRTVILISIVMGTEELKLLQVAALLLTSSMSSALAIAQVGKKGNTHAGWLPICGQVSKFCNHVSGALVAGILAAIFYYVLNLFTLYNVLNPLFVVKPN